MKFPPGIKVYGDKSYRGACPSETLETVTFFNYLRREYPDTYGILAYHPRNEGKRTHHQVMRDKSEGLVTGTCDIIIVGSPSLCIEMKRLDHTKSTITEEQIRYLILAQRFESMAAIALGHEAALEAFNDWIDVNNS